MKALDVLLKPARDLDAFCHKLATASLENCLPSIMCGSPFKRREALLTVQPRHFAHPRAGEINPLPLIRPIAYGRDTFSSILLDP
jgi:hypothetical protein